MGHRRLLAPVLVAVAVAFTACGNGDDPALLPSSTPSPSSAPPPAAPVADAIESTAERLRQGIGVGDPGCSVAIGREGQVIHAAGFGTAEVESGRLIDPDTSFDIGSTSKQFTGLALLLAAGDGDLALDDDIRRWVPELPRHPGEPATLRRLLHHTGGLPDYIDLLLDAGFDYGDPTTTQDALDALAGTERRDFEPGTDWGYSNTGYFLLGVALQRATGTSLPDYLDQRVFDPLGLTMVMDPVTPIPSEAVSYERSRGAWVVADSLWQQVGDGAVQTTPSELVRWADTWTTAPFGAAVLRAQLDGVPTGEGSRYGAGIEILRERLEHAGSWGGFTTEFAVDPGRRIAVAVTCNRPDLPRAEGGGAALLDLWVRALS